MTAHLWAAAFARSVPRYTSYPTALQFHPGVTSADYERWLANIPAETALSLYLHVPYCRQLCWYCACHTRVANGDHVLARYRDALLREIGLVRAAIGERRLAAHIHWGGGTPTTMAPGDLRLIHQALADSFEVRCDTEIAVEIDPRTLTDTTIEALAEMGTSRVSFGVQDFDPRVQQAINRIQPFDMTRRAVDRLRAAGVASINIDLVYGLPFQTLESLQRTVGLAAALRPDRMALFGYAHVPWLKRHQALIRSETLPGPELRWDLSQAAASQLVEGGYELIGIDHFALPADALARAAREGRLHRNFQGYTADASQHVLGFGASAIGAFPGGYVQNTADVAAWLTQIEAGRLATARGVTLTDEDRARRDIIERLMCDMSVDLAVTLRDRPILAPRIADAFAALQQLARLGIVELQGPKIRVTPGARALARVVAAAFDAYTSAAPRQHSVAV